jgi:hypothetical protein
MKRFLKYALVVVAVFIVSMAVLVGVAIFILFGPRSPEEVAEAKARIERNREIQAREQLERTRKLFLHYFNNDLDEVENLEGGCVFWLDAGVCRLDFTSSAEITLKQAWRYSPANCAEVGARSLNPEHGYQCSWDAEKGLNRCCSTTLIRNLTEGSFEFWEAICDFSCPSRTNEPSPTIDRNDPI